MSFQGGIVSPEGDRGAGVSALDQMKFATSLALIPLLFYGRFIRVSQCAVHGLP